MEVVIFRDEYLFAIQHAMQIAGCAIVFLAGTVVKSVCVQCMLVTGRFYSCMHLAKIFKFFMKTKATFYFHSIVPTRVFQWWGL